MKKEASRDTGTSRRTRGSRRKGREKDEGKASEQTPEVGADADGHGAFATDEEAAAGAPDPAAAAAAGTSDRAGEARIAELEADLAEASDRALRTLAEFDNFRRRAVREREDATARGMADVLRELLDVADNFDRALEHAGDDVPGPFLEGMRLVARGLHDLLDRKGVARMDAQGAPFDPERHDALTRQPAADVEPNTVVQVVQPGYMLHESVLRPAKVVVAMPVPASDAPGTPAGEDGGEGE